LIAYWKKDMFNFEKLEVYQESIVLVDQIYQIVNVWPKNEQFSLTDQFKRASISIVLNIAEGFSRTKKDFYHFIVMARGSCYECIAILTIANNRKYIADDVYEKIYQHCEKIARMLSALKKSIQ